jgi:hypothetical protein
MKRPTPHITFFADKYIGKPYSYIKAFSTELINEIVNNEDGVKMPLGLGVLQVIGKNSRSFDYKNSIKHEKKFTTIILKQMGGNLLFLCIEFLLIKKLNINQSVKHFLLILLSLNRSIY